MRERRFDLLAALRAPEPWGLPAEFMTELGYESPEDLSPAERRVWLAEGYLGEVLCEGHVGWWGSLYGDFASETPPALDAIGLPELAEVCRRSFAVWPGGSPPADPDEREEVIVEVWLEDDPEGATDLLWTLDGELYDALSRVDNVERFYRYLVANAPDFGLDPAEVPAADEVVRGVREARERQRRREREEDARGAPRAKRLSPVANAAVRVLSGAILLGGFFGVVGAVGIVLRRQPGGFRALALSLVLVEVGVVLRRVSRPLARSGRLAELRVHGLGCLRLLIAMSLLGGIGTLARSGAGALTCVVSGLAGFALWFLIWLRIREPEPPDSPDGAE